MEKLNKVFQTCIRTIHNKKLVEGSSLDNLYWVNFHADFLFLHAKSKESSHTRKNYLLAIGKLLKSMGCEHKRFYEEALIAKRQIEDTAKDQKINDHRLNNYVDWRSIIKKRNQLSRKFEKDKRNDNINLSYLLLCLYTMTPPIRNDYYKVKILTDIEDLDKENNYLIKINGRYNFYLNKDKMSYAKGPRIYKFSKKLCNVIDESLKYFDRDYLLCNAKGEHLTKQNVSAILGKLFHDKTLTIVNIRSAKINHFYKLNKTIRQKEHLADLMRHSTSTALRSYNKVMKDSELYVKRLKRLKNNDKLIIPRNRNETTLILD